jgi:hypothetical protein
MPGQGADERKSLLISLAIAADKNNNNIEITFATHIAKQNHAQPQQSITRVASKRCKLGTLM